MRRVEDGQALTRQRLHRLEDRVARLRVDPDGRFVQHEELRLVEQSDADVEPAFHTAGVLLGAVLAAVGEADDVEHLVDALVRHSSGHAVQRSEEPQVLLAGQVRVDRQVLRDEPDRVLALGRPRFDRRAHDSDGSLVGLKQSGQDRDRRRLPCAVRAEQAVRLTGADVQGHVVDRMDRAVPLVQAARFGHERRHSSSSR